MNPSKRRVKCSHCEEMKDAEAIVCKDCIEGIREEEYNAGYHSGEKDGYKEGVEAGKKDGYSEGYKEAMEEASRKLDAFLCKLKR